MPQKKINSKPKVGNDDFFADLVREDPEVSCSNNQVFLHKFEEELNIEIAYFQEILLDRERLEETDSNKKFWLEEKKKLPKLFQVATILLNISASSAYVERFFSICGIICHQRAARMSDDLIISRSMLASNMQFFKEMAETVLDLEENE